MQGRGGAAAGGQPGRIQERMRLEKLANRTLAQNSQDTHNFLCCFAAHPKAKARREECNELTSLAQRGGGRGDCDGTTPVSTAVALVALAALGQIPRPCCESFWVCRRVASGLFMYFVPLSLSLFSSLSLALLMCLQSNYAA